MVIYTVILSNTYTVHSTMEKYYSRKVVGTVLHYSCIVLNSNTVVQVTRKRLYNVHTAVLPNTLKDNKVTIE